MVGALVCGWGISMERSINETGPCERLVVDAPDADVTGFVAAVVVLVPVVFHRAALRRVRDSGVGVGGPAAVAHGDRDADCLGDVAQLASLQGTPLFQSGGVVGRSAVDGAAHGDHAGVAAAGSARADRGR